MVFFPERNGNAQKIISRVSEKRSIGFNAFYTFCIGSWLSIWCPNLFRIYMQGFPGIFLLYITGKSYGPSIFNCTHSLPNLYAVGHSTVWCCLVAFTFLANWHRENPLKSSLGNIAACTDNSRMIVDETSWTTLWSLVANVVANFEDCWDLCKHFGSRCSLTKYGG